jgi:hypothetical protein
MLDSVVQSINPSIHQSVCTMGYGTNDYWMVNDLLRTIWGEEGSIRLSCNHKIEGDLAIMGEESSYHRARQFSDSVK